MRKIENNRRSLKILSAALLGVAALGSPAIAQETQPVLGTEETVELLKNKPADTPTLYYLHQNNVLIPQKGEYNKTDKTWADADPIEAPESVYKITTGTEEDHTFDYTTADIEGNLTHNYYKIELRHPEQSEGALNLGTSDHIEWKKLETAPAEGTPSTISIKVSDTETQYYQYTYTKPENYEEPSTRINDTLTTGNAQYKVFKDITTTSDGGVIYNAQDKSIVDIIADFVNNFAEYNGGAIYNGVDNSFAIIGNINGDFINNSAVWGGAIYNMRSSSIGNIKGDFINNTAKNSGGANNSATGSSSASGGAIYNEYNSTIGNITGNFINNSSSSISDNAYGGAIYNQNSSTIGNITGDFINNSVNTTAYKNVYGGAIYNLGIIGNITGDFINNSANGCALGGAIYNTGIIGNITGNFINNSANTNSTTYHTTGGAIYNFIATIGNITGDFINNSASSGGAISNGPNATIGSITGDFINNSATGSYGEGGAIYKHSINVTIGNITGDFISNSAGWKGGAIYAEAREQEDMQNTTLPVQTLTILNDDGTVYKTLYMCEGSETDIKEAIDNGLLTGYIITGQDALYKSELEAGLAEAGVTFDEYLEFIKSQGVFISTTAPDYLFQNISMTYPHLTNAEVRAETADISLVNSNLLGNHVESENSQANGGAIYSENATIKLTVNNGKTSYISGNYVDRNGHKDDNAIYMNGGKLIFDTTNGSTIQLDDNIKGLIYKTYIIGDDKSKFVLNNHIYDAEVNLIETNLYLTNDSYLDNNDLILHSGNLNMLNNKAGIATLNSLTLTGNTNFIADVDLANAEMDRFTANSYGDHSGNLNVVGMNLLSDATSDKTEVFFAEQGLKNNVTTTVKELNGYTPIYKYNVTYNNKPDGGYFVFQRGSNGGNSSDAFNPSVLAPSVAAQAGATATMGQVFNYAFQNADNFMNIPYLERISIKNANKYALSPTGDATDVGVFSPLFTNNESSSVWVKPYASFENVPLKNGPKVSNITYGTLIGYDTNLIPMKNGWDRVWTGYIGYNGASQRYSGIDSTQNGGLLGGTLTLYKGNFFNATTLSAGANVANNQTMYGNENFTMLLAGLGNKTGYNFEFKEGKLILQPSMLMSYTFVNTFDYTNAAGVKMNSNPLHAIQLAPGLKLIGNLKNGWQPYASVNMVWNLLDKSDVRANDVKLPEMSIKPYIQYGVGVQKRFKDRCMAFGQAMIQNGGRNGISLTAGFRWSLGKEGKGVNEKVMNPSKNTVSDASQRNRTVLKQLTPTEKTALGAKPQNTTRTTNVGILKRM